MTNLKQGWFTNMPKGGKLFLIGVLVLVVIGGIFGVATL